MTAIPSPQDPAELELEPIGLIGRSTAVARMGAMMLGAGTGSYRVKQAMGRVAAALGIRSIEAQVNLTEIVVTTREGPLFRTQVVEVPVPGVDADRIGALLRISLAARHGLTVAEFNASLDEVEAMPHRHSLLTVVAAAAVACAAFAFLNHGGWPEVLAAGLGAGVGKVVQLRLRRVRANQLAIVGLAALTASVVYMLAALGLGAVLPGGSTPGTGAFISAMLFLVPGFPLMTAALDLARLDLAAGLYRLSYAALITLAAGMAAWVVAAGFRLDPTVPAPPSIAWGLLLGLRILASFFGVLGFALTFNTPWRGALTAAGIGAVANTLRLAMVDAGVATYLAGSAGTLIIGVGAAFLSQRMLSPRITLSVPAMLVMIPGVTTYHALVSFVNGDVVGGLGSAVSSLFVIIALATGLAVARMLTDPAWTVTRPSWTSQPATHAQRIVRGEI